MPSRISLSYPNAKKYVEPKEAQRLVKKKEIPNSGKSRYNELETSGAELLLFLLLLLLLYNQQIIELVWW